MIAANNIILSKPLHNVPNVGRQRGQLLKTEVRTGKVGTTGPASFTSLFRSQGICSHSYQLL
jgi:hypothetical protein